MTAFIRLFAVFISLLSLSTFSHANGQNSNSPYVLVEQLGGNLFSQLQTMQGTPAQKQQQIQELVKNELMPHVDYPYASYKILGKQVKKLTKAQHKQFVAAMHDYLITTYATALSKYNNQSVSYEPAKALNGKKIATVGLTISGANQPDIDMAFKLRKSRKTGEWKAFDMVVEGISLLHTKRAEINAQMQRNGFDKVVTQMYKKSHSQPTNSVPQTASL